MTTVVDIEGLYELIKNSPSPDCVDVDHETILSAIESIKIENDVRKLIIAASVPNTHVFDLTVDLVKATLAELASVSEHNKLLMDQLTNGRFDTTP